MEMSSVKYKCTSCYKTFPEPKVTLGKAGCPNCSGQNFHKIPNTDNGDVKQECPYCQHIHQFLCQMNIFKCDRCNKDVNDKDFEKVFNENGVVRFMLSKRSESEFERVAREIGQLLNKKNKDYGNAFVDIVDFMKLMFPNGIPENKYIHALALTRIFDKMKRIVNVSNEGDIENPYSDIAGYGILMSTVWGKNWL